VILSHIGFNLPFALLLLRSFFASIPRDLEQAAIIDGCTLWGGFWRIALPLAAPGIATTTIFCLLYSWNEFLFCAHPNQHEVADLADHRSLFYHADRHRMGANLFHGGHYHGAHGGARVLIRNHFVKGLTMGALKG